MKQAVNFRLESEKIAALDRLAQSLDRDRSYLLSAGKLIDHDDVMQRMRKKMQRRRKAG